MDPEPIVNSTEGDGGSGAKLEEIESVSITVVKTNLDALFLVIMGSIIIFMQAGFGFLEAGSIRAKNTTNILIKNFADLTFGNSMSLRNNIYHYTVCYF